MSEEVIVVLVTAPNQEVARSLARTLVEESLVACANILPGIESVYRWKGEICEDSEVLVILKTGASRLSALASRVKELHPYELPEVLALPAAGGLSAYLSWVLENSRG